MNRGEVQAADLAALAAGAEEAGAHWSLSGDRELDANLVHLPAGGRIGEHTATLDVAIVGVAGSGTVSIAGEPVELRPAMLVFVPAGSPRQMHAGRESLTYLTVHRRRNEGLEVRRSGGATRAEC